MSTVEPERLSSWKEISQFLDCSDKTARRWEVHRNLPVHRIPGGAKSSVYAYRDELQKWLEGNPAEDVAPHSPAPNPSEQAAGIPGDRRRRHHWAAWVAGLTAAGVVIPFFLTVKLRNRPDISLSGSPEILTLSTEAKLPPLITDGRRVYFQESVNGHFQMMWASLTERSSGPLGIPLENPD